MQISVASSTLLASDHHSISSKRRFGDTELQELPLAVDPDRVAFAPPEIQFAFGAIFGWVGARMAAVTIGHTFDQRGSASRTGFVVSGFGGAM